MYVPSCLLLASPQAYSEEIVDRVRGAKGGISFESFTGFAYFLPIFIVGVKEANTYVRSVPDWTSDPNCYYFGLAVLLITIIPHISMAVSRIFPKYFRNPLQPYFVLYCILTVRWLAVAPPEAYLACVVGILCMWCLPNAMLKLELKAQEECPTFVRDSTVSMPAIVSSMLNCYTGLLLGMAYRPIIQCKGNIDNDWFIFIAALFIVPVFIWILGYLIDMCLPYIKRCMPVYMCKSFLPASIALLLCIRPLNGDIEGEDMQNVWIRERNMATYIYLLIALLMNLPICSIQRILDPALFLFGFTLLMFV